MKNLEKLLEKIKLNLTVKKARIEVVSKEDPDGSRELKKYAYRVAENLSYKHPNLKILRVYRTTNLWNFDHPLLYGLFTGYVILVPLSSELKSLKKSCMELELDEKGKRIADIDVYLNVREKISRTDLGYEKK